MSRGGGRWFAVAIVLVLGWLVVAGTGGPYAGKLSEVAKNDNAAFLPASAEATRAQDLAAKFASTDTVPTIVVYERAGGLTDADRTKIGEDVAAFGKLPNVVPPLIGPVPSTEQGGAEAIEVIVPFSADIGDPQEFIDAVKSMRSLAGANADGLVSHVTGPGGLLADLVEVFGGLDTTLLFVTAIVVVVILLLVYRSPVLWIVPLLCVGAAFGLSALLVYQLAEHDVIKLNGQSQGILTVLVFGAGTDYALLLISRYREELRRHAGRPTAMLAAMRGAAPAIIASGVTVIVSLLCLLLSELNSNRGLGPVAAIGIACTLVTMLTFLPALLVLLGRWVFWPRIPRQGEDPHDAGRAWSAISAFVGRRSRIVWGVTGVLLLAMCAGLFQLNASGLSQSQSFTGRPDSVVGQEVLAKHFPAGAGSPAVVIASASALSSVVDAARGVEGVDRDAVLPLPASPDAPQQPKVVDGLVQVQVTLTDAPDSAAAIETVKRLRTAEHAVPGANAVVGGFTAVNLDTQDASRHDRNLIIPVVLLVILVVLALLLRALLAPLLLIVTVVLSFAASLGVSALLFRHVLHFAGEDTAFPLFAFVFLVALGIDYNIFLMTRVREESVNIGTRDGTLRGLAVTGGVITSAGVVLAATFSALAVVPLVFLAEVGVTVAFGVLLDTVVVRTLLVPALTYDIGSRVWWPSKLVSRV